MASRAPTTRLFSPISCARSGAIETTCARHLRSLRALAGEDFDTLEASTAEAVATALLGRDGAEIMALGRAVLQCYYRDDRVVRSLGLEPRAPYPKGHVLEQGDWSLLDAVRGRPRMWRDVEGRGR